MAAPPSHEPDSDSIFQEASLSGRSIGLLDPADSSSGSSRKPSYDSRESKSISECSFVSGSPCGSPLRPLAQATPYSSTCTMESDTPGERVCLDPFQSEKEFIDYLMSLPTSKPEVRTEPLLEPVAPKTSLGVQSPKIGLDHLENLCKLMEQLGELREQNFKLQKRVQYLEEVRCLNEMRKDLKEALDGAALEPSRGVQDELGSWDPLPPEVQEVERRPEVPEVERRPEVPEPKRAKSYVKMRKSALQQQRLRSQSMGDDDVFRKPGLKAKVSKWTKVKEALKWERVQVEHRGATVDARSSFFVDVDDEQPLPLMVSKATVTLAPAPKPHAPAASCDDLQQRAKLAGRNAKPETELIVPYLMTDPYLDSTSEEEEETLTKEADPREKRRSIGATLDFDVLDGDPGRKPPGSGKYLVSHGMIMDDEQAMTKERKGRSLERTEVEHRGDAIRYTHSEKESKKLSKGAWGKVKNIIQTRKDSLKRKHRKSGGADADPAKSPIEPDFSSSEGFVFGDEAWAERYDIGSYGRGGEDERQVLGEPVVQTKSKHSSSSSNYGGEDPSLEFLQDKPRSKRGKAQQLTIQVPADDPEVRLKHHSTTPPTLNVTASGYSPNSQRKSKWNKVKNVFLEKRKTEMGLTPQRPQSVPASPTNLTSFTYEDLGILEEYLLDAKNWAERKENRGAESGPYDSSVAALQSLLADAEGAPAPLAAETKRNLEELQRNISQDFSKKMQEWERLKTSYTRQQQNLLQTSPKLDRKGSAQKSRKGKPEKDKEKGKEQQQQHKEGKQRDKELQWLEKQLQKIEREKQRLAKERQKYLKREARLEKMKETMLHPPEKHEVLVRTAAGEFRFEGISHTFTRKLYEWEEMKGIGPEVSTIALLDAQHPEPERVLHTLSPPAPRYGRLDRHRSRSESSVADIVNVQTSTTSLAPDDLVDDVFADATAPHSRAASEPDIAFELDDAPCALEVEELHFEEDVPCLEIPAVRVEEPVYSYAPSEVTRLIDSSGSSDAEREAAAGARKASARSRTQGIPEERTEEAGIQEEDLRLLRKLTAKEEVCRRLECDLEDLDGRMKMMFQQHSEEIQKLKSQEAEDNQEFRTSSPGSPVDTSKQKQLIGELRARIEELEKAGDCLKKEREDLEKTFKLNSEQQAQLTQHLAARITELQQKNIRIRHTADDQKLADKVSGQTKKKQGVVKVQEISAELLTQAKTLEQALLDRNATIRQLQWELIQRDMSAMHLQTELQKVKDKTVDVLGGTKDSKQKEKHERSWSSVDTTVLGGSKQEDKGKLPEIQKPLQRFADNPDLTIRPLELTRKVRELKTELMRLWSSTESATSGSSELAEDAESGKEKDVSGNGFETAAMPKAQESLSKQSSESLGKPSLGNSPFPAEKDSEISAEDKSIATILPPANISEEIVTARRVSDTAIPKESSDLGMSPKPLRGKLTRSSAKVSQTEDKIDDSAKGTEALMVVSKIPSRVCPPSPFMAARPDGAQSEEQPKNTTTALSITLSLKPKVVSGQAVRPERTSKLKKMAAVSRPSEDSEVKLFKTDSVVLPPTTVKPPSSPVCPSERLPEPEEPTTTAVVVLPQKAPLKSECLPYPKKSPSTKDHRNAHLQRQNAEDVGSSSDTDTEGSGITFTINLGKKDLPKTKTKTENIAAMIPLRKPEKAKEGTSSAPGCASPPASRMPPETRRGCGVMSPPQTPSPQPWRKLLREDTVIQRASSSQIPAPQRPSMELLGSPPGTPKERKEPKAEDEEMPTAPETPVVKSRSTRKLKLPSAGRLDPASPVASPGLEPSPLRTRRAAARPVKDPAPNVKSMIEKYNQKLAEQPPVSLLRSPQLGVQRTRAVNGVQKSTSFTDPSATSPQRTPAAGECVFKSASASTIEGPGSPSLNRMPPMSPESLKRTQPIGIASRIPRCLKPISEQDSIEAAKDSKRREPDSGAEPVAQPSPAAVEGPLRTRMQTPEAALQSPKAGMRLMQLRRAREEFLTKSPASPTTDRHQYSSTESESASPLRPCGWKPFAPQTPPTPPEALRRRNTDSSSEEARKPKGILKASRREATWSVSEQEPEPKTDASGRIVKSASAGTMEEVTSSEDGSRSSETLPQTHKCGLFHFKFRKAKLKQKKEPLNTVKALCRQSLLVDIEPGAESDSPSSPGVGTRSCPNSPELQPRPAGKTGWLSKPRILFKSK